MFLYICRNQHLLCVDALNYCSIFYCGDFYNVANLLESVKGFANAATAAGYKLEVFLDVGIDSPEALKKWRTRREREVRRLTRRVMQGNTQFIGDAFRKCGVRVHYSIKDNDDTLVSHAAAGGGSVLSQDRDMFRYEPRPYQVCVALCTYFGNEFQSGFAGGGGGSAVIQSRSGYVSK